MQQKLNEELNYYKELGIFSAEQLAQIQKGLADGLDVKKYANPKFDHYQMMEIANGMRLGLDVSWYAKPEFNLDQMEVIKGGLEDGLDVAQYADPELSVEEMDEVYERLIAEQEAAMEEVSRVFDLK